MKYYVRGIIVSSIVASSLFAVSDKNLTIATGSESGNYYNIIGPSLVGELQKNNYNATVITSNGSVDNLNLVSDPIEGKDTLGIAQADVVHDLIKENDKYSSIELNGNLGYECGFLVVRKDRIDDIKSFKVGDKIAAGKEGSGTLHTFQNIVRLNPALNSVEVNAKSGIRYIDKVDNDSYTGYFFMSMPDPEKEEIKEVLKNPNLEFMPFDKDSVNIAGYDTGVNPIYSFQNIPIKVSFGKTVKSLTTICTYAGIVANEDLAGEKLLNTLYKASQNIKTEKETAWGFFQNLKETVIDKAETLKEKF